jgi:hypothetical protein
MVGYGRSRVDAPTRKIYALFPSPVHLIIVVNNLRLDEAIREISGTLGREGRRECCGYSEVFYVVAPACVG